MQRRPARLALLATLVVLGLLAAAPLASAASVTITGVGRADYIGSGNALMFTDPDTGITANKATQLVAPLPRKFPIRCLDDAALSTCAKVAKRSTAAIRYKVLRPIAFAVNVKNARFSLTSSPAYRFSIQGCGSLRLRGSGTYVMGRKSVHYRFKVLQTVPIPCGRIRFADVVAAIHAGR